MPGGPSVPDAPDTSKVMAEQSAANKEAAIASQRGSMVDQYNPYGSLQYSQAGTDQYGNPTYKANINLTPEQQSIFDYFQGTQNVAGQQGQNLLTNANYGAVPDLGTGENSMVTQAMQRNQAYMQPHFTSQTNALDNQLRNQGLVPGTTAYKNAMRTLTDNQTRQVGDFLNSTQNQAYNQSVNTYQLPLATSSMLANLGKPSAGVNESLVNAPGAQHQAVNATGIYANNYNQQMEAYKQKQARYSEMISGIAGIGGTLAGMPFGMPGLGGQIGSSIGGSLAG